MPAGRPTKYKPEFAELALKQIGEEGQSVTQFARNIRVNKSTIYQWAEDNPEFSDALKSAQEWSQAFWEDRLIGFMPDKNVNAPLVKLYFANRFKWHDRPEPENEGAAQSLNITFEVAEPVKDVKVTHGSKAE